MASLELVDHRDDARSGRGRRLALLALGGAGIATGLFAALLELSDSEPRYQLWVSAAAGTALLAAVLCTSTDDVRGWVLRAQMLVGAGVCSILAIAALWRVFERTEPRILVLLVPAVLIFVTAGLSVRESRRLHVRLDRTRLMDQMRGRESERRRWAQELHDETLQDLAGLDVLLAELAARPAAGPVREELLGVRDRVREEITLLRHLINELRPLTLDLLGLVPALGELAARTHDTSDVEVRLDLDELPRDLAPDVQVAVYRIVQEAVTNAVRHAQPTVVEVAAAHRDGALEIVVRDDGVGMARTLPAVAGPGGRGRVGMRERTIALGGSIGWVDDPRGGTRVVLRLPDGVVAR